MGLLKKLSYALIPIRFPVKHTRDNLNPIKNLAGQTIGAGIFMK
jgi:hypothetical protein